MIRARGLSRRFGAFVAVEDVDLDIERGEVFGFLGPNGAGKTTIMRMLCGLVAPTTGTAEIGGISVTEAPDRVRAIVGLLTETPGLYVRLSAVENLEFFARLHGMKAPGSRIESLLRRFGLWERRHEATGAYSKGMRQKLAIARAVMHEPKVLFLDEPTSALDPEAARGVRELVRELEEGGTTIILCTHNLDEAERLCDRIAVIKRRVLCVEAPHSLDGRGGQGAQETLRVVLGAPATAALELVRSLPGVVRAEAVGSELCVVAPDVRAVSPAVVRALVLGGQDVVSVEQVRRRLEDVYLDLVSDEPGAGAHAPPSRVPDVGRLAEPTERDAP